MPDPSSGVAGAVNSDSNLVKQILSLAPTAIPVNPVTTGTDPKIGIKTVKPQELEGCDETGAQVFMIFMVGDPYTKPS